MDALTGSDRWSEMFREMHGRIMGQREEILKAFIAKFGTGPESVEQVIQEEIGGRKWYVRVRSHEADDRTRLHAMIAELSTILHEIRWQPSEMGGDILCVGCGKDRYIDSEHAPDCPIISALLRAESILCAERHGQGRYQMPDGTGSSVR